MYRSRSYWSLAALGAAAMLAGCSTATNSLTAALQQRASTKVVTSQGMHVEFGPYQSAPVKRGGGWISPSAAQTGIIYGASYNGGFINLYALKGTNQTVIGQLTNSLLSPQGIVVDGEQRVWVANTNAGNIVAFKRGATTPFRILKDANEYPISVAVDQSLNVYAANAESTSGPPGNVVMYARGKTSPTAVLTYSDFNIVLGLGVDGLGNLYVSYIGSFGPSVVEFPKGSRTGQPVNLADVAISDIIFNHKADLLMEDGSGGVGVWPPPYSGGPMRTIPAFGNEPTLTRPEYEIWVALANPNTPEILGYAVDTGKLLDTITNGFNGNAWPYGVAIDPRASL